MSRKAILLLLTTSSMLLKADVITEYFRGTTLSTTLDTRPAYMGSPGGFYNIYSGSPIIGSFSFDPSLGTEQIGLVASPAGFTDVSYSVPATLTVQDTSGSVNATGNAQYTVGTESSSDVAGLWLPSMEDGSVVLNLPIGAFGDLSPAEFPWGEQALNNCAYSVYTCSSGTMQDYQSSYEVVFSIDAVSLTPFSSAPEPSSMPICALGIIGVVAALTKRRTHCILDKTFRVVAQPTSGASGG